MKTRLLAIFAIGIIGFVGTIHASESESEPEPVGVDTLEYGIFDSNDNKTHLLKVGQKYEIKIHFKSELDESVPFRYSVQVLDKDRHWSDPVDEFVSTDTLKPSEEKQFSFEWTPEYEGKFRTFVEIGNPVTNTAMGGATQYDFEVIQHDVDDPLHDYLPTYRIMNLEKEYFPNEQIRPHVLKKDLDGCNAYKAKIISEDTRQQVWEYTYISSCIVLGPPTEIESKVNIPTNKTPIAVDELGDYVLVVEMGDYEIQKAFSVVDEKSTDEQICGLGNVLVDGICLTPEPKQDYSDIKEGSECGLGTTYQDGICIANQTEEKANSNPSDRWGNPYIAPPVSFDEPFHLIPNPNPDSVIQGGIILSVVLFGIVGCAVVLFVIWRKRK